MKALILISMLFFTISAMAKIKPSSTKIIQNKFFLGDKESDLLKKELTKHKFSAETFTLQFACDKYKRTPSSKNRSLNCRAISVSPDQN